MAHPTRPDEKALARFVLQRHEQPMVNRSEVWRWWLWMGWPAKRLLYVLGKWSDRRWWGCGVSLRTGWVEPDGLEPLAKLAKDTPAAVECPECHQIGMVTQTPIEHAPEAQNPNSHHCHACEHRWPCAGG